MNVTMILYNTELLSGGKMERINISKNSLKTVSLFSGIGGLDLGFIYNGFNIIWANELDKYAVQTYKQNIDNNIIEGDILELYKNVPQHDVLLAGFPCQPFSMMGKKLGFDDERGTLFFKIKEIIELNNEKPKIIVLENVKNLLSHDNGKTFKKMKNILEELNYEIYAEVLDSKDYGVPQTRRRVFVVAFEKNIIKNDIKFEFPKKIDLKVNAFDLLDDKVDKKYFLSNKILPTILAHGSGNYYSKSEIDLEIARPLTATMHKMHRANQDNYYTDNKNRENFEDTVEKRISNVRKLTPNECRKLQGFPEDWKQVVSDTQAYRQFGNSVTVDVAYYISRQIIKYLEVQDYEF